jgi:hypothetical protein
MSDVRLPLERGIGGFEPRGNLDRTMRIEWPRMRRRQLITAGTALAVAVAGAFGAAAFFGHATPYVGRRRGPGGNVLPLRHQHGRGRAAADRPARGREGTGLAPRGLGLGIDPPSLGRPFPGGVRYQEIDGSR